MTWCWRRDAAPGRCCAKREPGVPAFTALGIPPGSWYVLHRRISAMSPKAATCHRLLTGQCVCRPFLEIRPQTAQVLQAPNIFLNHAGARTLKGRQAYAICCFFYMIKTCSEWSPKVLPLVLGASAPAAPRGVAACLGCSSEEFPFPRSQWDLVLRVPLGTPKGATPEYSAGVGVPGQGVGACKAAPDTSAGNSICAQCC